MTRAATRAAMAIAAMVFLFGLGCRAEPPSVAHRSASVHPAESKADWGALRVHRVGEGTGPVAVLLHGFGAPGDDLVQLARALDVRGGARFVLPEAPIALPQGGRAWWPIDERELVRARTTGHPEDLGDRHPAGLVGARRAVLSVLHAASERFGVPESRMIIGGFSPRSSSEQERIVDASISRIFSCLLPWRPGDVRLPKCMLVMF